MIEVAVQRGSFVYVYGNGNRLLFSVGGTLQGYTSTTVTVKRYNVIYTYNDKNSLISSH